MKVSKCDQIRSFPQNVFAKETEFVPSSVCNKLKYVEKIFQFCYCQFLMLLI